MKNLKSLIAKLDDTCRRALEGAAGLCLSRTNYAVEIEHLLLKLLDQSSTDLHRISNHFGINVSRFSKELTAAIDTFKTGNAGTPSLSPRIPRLVSDAWLIASVDMGSPRVRSGHLLLALLQHEEMGPYITQNVRELLLVKPEALRDQFARIVGGSDEDREMPTGAEAGAPAGVAAPGPGGKTQALDQFTIDLTTRAKAGLIDPVTGRDFEIRQVVDILMRRRQNNPILTGEAGVGKTAVVEGFALRVAEGDVPPPLQGVAVRTLDLGLLQAGAGIKGEFENRLKSVIEEVKASAQPIILFIDEAHTMIGAGGQAGQNDAANLLKPALARGELRTIAATTWSEYKKYFEKDAALARRFQVVKIEEPTADQAVLMMRYLAPKLEKHHQVRILDEAVESAVRLSDRYLSGRQLPDKSVSVLDTACARLAISHAAVPGPLEDVRRRLAALDHEIAVLEREQVTSARHDERLAAQRTLRDTVKAELDELEGRWDKERNIIQQLRETRALLEAEDRPAAGNTPAHAVSTAGAGSATTTGSPAAAASAAAAPTSAGAAAASASANAPAAAVAEPDAQPSRTREQLRADLDRLTAELAALQGDRPLMHPVVDAQTVADVIAGWTGIPVGKMKGHEIQTILALQDRLAQRVLGQSHALEQIAERIRISRARLEDPRKPIGVFMLVGPSGVGKTETALALAETLYGGEQNLITINMSEYQEAHTVSSLKGSPPGYVGYGEGGVLTEAVRRKPYSVVLLDEVEKAHGDVLELFYQVFDKGMLEDGEGREIDFKNTVILLTSNVGTDTIMKLCADEDTRPEAGALGDAIRPELLKHFPPAFLGRLMVVPYFRISDTILRQIIHLQLGRVRNRIRANHRADFVFDEAVVDAIKSRCTEVDSGARNVEHILTRTLLPEISNAVLSRLSEDAPITAVRVTADASGAFQYSIN
jgi:type VI secretion system protein VasG